MKTRQKDGSGWNLALPKIRRERAKLVKLANFKPAKKPMKIGTWPTWPTFFGCFGGPRRLVRTLLKQKDGSGWNLALPKIRRKRAKLVKLANFKPAKIPIKIGTWPTWPSFIDVLVGLRRLVRTLRIVGFETHSSCGVLTKRTKITRLCSISSFSQENGCSGG